MSVLARAVARIILVATICLFVSAPRVLTQTKTVSLDELTQSSDVIAVGQVKNMTSEWDETGTRIRTKVQVSVDQLVAGTNPGSTLTLYVPGGEVGTVGEFYSHMPVFKREEQVVVFATQDKQHHYRVSAGVQGKFTVQKDQTTGKPIVPGHATLEEFTSMIKTTVIKLQSGDKPAH